MHTESRFVLGGILHAFQALRTAELKLLQTPYVNSGLHPQDAQNKALRKWITENSHVPYICICINAYIYEVRYSLIFS